MKHSLVAFAFLVACTSVLVAQNPYYHTNTRYEEPGSEGRDHPLDIERMVISVSFSPEDGEVHGRVTHIFHPIRERVDTIVFDGVNMRISEARLNNKAVRYIVNDSTVTVIPDSPLHFGSTDSISFTYDCTPRRGMHFTGWNDATKRARRQIWTQGEDSDNRNWCPMYDYPNDKMITETYVRFDSSYKVLSNGNLISKTANNDGSLTWHYAMTKPHVTYLVMIAIGKYAIEERKTAKGLPVHLWYYPEYPERIGPTYRYSTEMIDFMEQQLGVAFPWESYSQVPLQDYIFGAMENTTATTFGDFSFCDARGVLDRNYLNTNVHELTHQWFGDYVTERDWKSIWLHESFATFYPKMFMRKFLGEDNYQWARRGEQNQALSAGEKDRLPIVHPASGTARRYPKGSAVLDMLRYVVGESNFDRAVTHYLKSHPYGPVHTDEFYLAFQDEIGMSLDWFFDEWLYHGGEPSYKVSTSDITDNNTHQRSTIFSVEQVQIVDELSPLFRMPVVFEVHYSDGTSSRVREIVDKQHETIAVANPDNKAVAFCLFDPGSYILKKVEFKKTLIELQQQCLHATNMIDRYDAVRAMHEDSTLSEEETEIFLAEQFTREKFHAVRSEIVARMSKSRSDRALNVLKAACKDPDVEVRKAVLSNLRRVPEKLTEAVTNMLSDSSYVVIENALSKLCDSYPNRFDEFCTAVQSVDAPGARVRIAVLERRALRGKQAALDSLVDYCSTAFEFGTRQNAMNALKRLNYCDAKLVPWMIQAILSSNNRLADVARGMCETWITQTKMKQLFVDYYRATQWKPWQKEILVKLLGERPERRRR